MPKQDAPDAPLQTENPVATDALDEPTGSIDLSVLVPLYQEQDNVAMLVSRLFDVLPKLGLRFEVIAVDDGSRDKTLANLQAEAANHPELKVISLRRNYGQTAAMMAGIDHASGESIITIDADLQNDPEDIPVLLEKMKEGYDVVSGWRQNRKDAAIRRTMISRVANRVISWASGVTLKDYGCTLKAYRAEIIKGVRLYGEMHRFIPIYASWMGARITEIPVRHHPRRFGASKYGLERIGKVILDLLVVKFLERYFVKPIYVFGAFGLVSMVLSAITFSVLLYLRLVEHVSMILTPLPLLTVLFFLVGVMGILMGLLAEAMVRTYYESQGRPAYLVRKRVNFGAAKVKST
ncbi:MAG: glycosyltransferase family 2 protein [Polyangia bacterium]